MEVHAHTHTPRKKWAHYFWEFLMLFLAVFCGFLAENQREHYVEGKREKQYMQSMVEDLKADTASFENNIDWCERTIRRSDSLMALLNMADKNKGATEIYYFLLWLTRSDFFNVDDRTIVQLRNAGGMRLISRKTISNNIIKYYNKVERVEILYEAQLQLKHSLRALLPEILDGNDYGAAVDKNNSAMRPVVPVKLRITNPDVINNIIINLQNIKGMNITLKIEIEDLKDKAINTGALVIKEYHLK